MSNNYNIIKKKNYFLVFWGGGAEYRVQALDVIANVANKMPHDSTPKHVLEVLQKPEGYWITIKNKNIQICLGYLQFKNIRLISHFDYTISFRRKKIFIIYFIYYNVAN